MERITELTEERLVQLIGVAKMHPNQYSLEANPMAILLHRMLDVSFAKLKRIMKANDFVSRGAIARFEEEFLRPTIAHFMQVFREAQLEEDAIVKALLETGTAPRPQDDSDVS